MIGNLLPIVLAGGDARAIVAGELNLMNDRDEHALSLLIRGHLLGGEELENRWRGQCLVQSNS